MKAWQIMDGEVKWKMRDSTARDCHCAIRHATDYADWRESLVLIESTLNAGDFMAEAMK